MSYIIQKTSGSFCPECHSKVDLLCRLYSITGDVPTRNDESMFYICWNCQSVAEVGVGPVRRVKAETRKYRKHRI